MLMRNHSDSGLFLAGLSASLQIEIQEGSLAQIPYRVYLEDPKCPVRATVNWSSPASISAVIRGIVSSKATTGLDESVMDSVVIPLIIQAFVSVFGYVVQYSNESVPVQLLFAPGQKSLWKSEVWKQTILLDLPWPIRGSRQGAKKNHLSPPLCNVRVALFNITIEPLAEYEEEEADSAVNINHSGSLAAFRLKALRQVGDRLQGLGATAVLSQKIIPKYLQTYLASKGIFTLDRLSATNIRAVQMLSGSIVLSDWRIDDSIFCSSLGFLSLISTQTLGSKQFIRLHREDPASQPTTATGYAHPVTTIAIAAPDQFAYDELRHVITTSLKTLAALIDEPHVVAGAGCVEIHLAALLRDRANQLRMPNGTASEERNNDTQTRRTLRHLNQTVTAFGDCMERMAEHLCGSDVTATDRTEMIEQVRAANIDSLLATTTFSSGEGSSQHNELFGWDPRKHSVMSVLSCACQEGESQGDEEKMIADACILDVLQSKKDALVLAIESVSSLSCISSVVRAP
ncbi:McKusick-Kaufman/Bardet-Biedl syndromes putative chaperonin [Phytophthora citrophthora]|uniref:McKusick-Kaufman/Bardet-Biedl syndromes putative chaperonin n=1 Tax=Phytophthora citrophthora TaxID=4793 RepID=A0AAD9LFT7_9STRA|nr:McKusick-Kaufman/Bardet-Biedl syndromes putative chaperonin [Phytophthora citrophthora]